MQRTTILGRFVAIALLGIACACSSDAQEQSLTLREAFPNIFFTNPVGLTYPDDGSNRLFVVEQGGTIRGFENSASVAGASVFLDIRSRVTSGGELGLLGLAFHPNYAENGYFYVNYTAPNPLRTVIARYRVSAANPDVADANSETVLLEYTQPYPNHNGGQLAFGPDGYLYIAAGDGGLGGDPLNHGQTLDSLLGKILRIDVDNEANGKKYAIPADNPFVGNTAGYREEIFAYGLRNPWRFSFDPQTGWLWCGDVGQGVWEEVNIIEKGKNYGWRILEGRHCYPPGTENCDTTGLTMPIWEYNHSLGVAIAGGYVYRGGRLPGLVGEYVYGDFGTGRIWGLRYDGTAPATNRLLLASGLTISSFGVDAERELYFCSFNGKIYTFDSPTGNVTSADKPAASALLGAQPNPTSGSTVFRYSIPSAAHVQLIVRDLLGRVVATLVDREEAAGEHEVRFDAVELPVGNYNCTLRSEDGTVASQSVTVVR